MKIGNIKPKRRDIAFAIFLPLVLRIGNGYSVSAVGIFSSIFSINIP